jgi:ribosomal protein L7/L12
LSRVSARRSPEQVCIKLVSGSADEETMVVIAALATLAIVVLVVALRSGDDRVQMPSSGGADMDSVEGLIQSGRKIDAIKLYRRERGVGLREAKDAVDEIAASFPRAVSH